MIEYLAKKLNKNNLIEMLLECFYKLTIIFFCQYC